MRLRNKKTGEIVELLAKPSFVKRDKENYLASEVICFDSLAELNKEWEDYEEPTGYWYIDFDGDVLGCVEDFDKETDEKRKQIGNYFETKEEAEKAVEKLKAWKRLKDKGFRFNGVEVFSEGLLEIDSILPALKGADNAERLKIIDDLDLLFSGDEE